VIRAIRERGMTSTLTTGGFSMTRERAEAMVEAGVQSVSVSIDGLEVHHDHLRGREGSWQRALLGPCACCGRRARRSRSTPRSTAHLGDLPELLELLAPEGIHAWQVQVTVAHGGAADHHELLLQPYMYLELFPVLDRLADRCDQLRITLTPANSLGYFGPYAYKLRRRQSRQGPLPRLPGRDRRDRDRERRHDQKLPEPRRPQQRRRVVARARPARDLGARAGARVHAPADERELWGYCAECYYASICKGGCTSVSEPLLGRPGNNPCATTARSRWIAWACASASSGSDPPTGEPFDNSLFRVIREHKDPALRAQRGPVQVDEPRSARADEPFGPGTPVDLST
jgi:MoaA/NifB/PqqE/SkfB family radical SAM enzyme